MKSGWKTSEFWLALAGKAAGIVTMLYGHNPIVQAAGGILAGLSTHGYSVSRGNAKAAAVAAAQAAVKAGLDSIGQKK